MSRYRTIVIHHCGRCGRELFMDFACRRCDFSNYFTQVLLLIYFFVLAVLLFIAMLVDAEHRLAVLVSFAILLVFVCAVAAVARFSKPWAATLAFLPYALVITILLITVFVGGNAGFSSDLKEAFQRISKQAPPKAFDQASRENAANQSRIWTDATGEFSREAVFVKYSEDERTVSLRRQDGVEIEIQVERLSDADKEWLQDIAHVDIEPFLDNESEADADPKDDTTRTWISADRSQTVEATLLEYKDGRIRIRRSDGKEFEVPLDGMSEEDQAWVKERYSP